MTSFERWIERGATAKVLVIGKLVPVAEPTRFHRVANAVLSNLRQAQVRGAKIVGDFSDDHFSHPDIGYYWRELAGLVDIGVAASERMAATLRPHCRAPIHVVPDPLSSPKGHVKSYRKPSRLTQLFRRSGEAQSHEAIKLAWYGHPNNLRHLWPWIEQLGTLDSRSPWILWIVTKQRDDVIDAVATLQRRIPAHGLIELIEWSEEEQWSVVSASDIVLLPSDNADASSSVKSANRLTDALHAGRPVIASPLHSYLPYADYVDLGGNVVKGISSFRSFPKLWHDRTLAGQAHVAKTLGLPAIAQAWRKVLENCSHGDGGMEEFDIRNIAQRKDLPPIFTESNEVGEPNECRETEKSVRLNLGCGDKILTGYINVDVVQSRAGYKPDVICDLHDLKPFDNACADEVMAIHVIEHFWRWEVETVLREWVRVLKPGGRMVLECPNLISACRQIMDNPESANGVDKSVQRTLWVLYGDPSWRDPLMTHRWAYTPASLASLMESAGLVDVRQEPAQFKLREPRDMRIVGFRK